MDARPHTAYRRRRNALSRGEREWRVEPDALVSVGVSGHVRRWPWREFAGVRLCHAPARDRPWRYTFELRPKHGQKIELDNAHYVSRGLYEDRSDTYTPFVRAALDRLHATNPKLRALSGETGKRYFFLLFSSLVALGAAAYALIALRTPLDALPYANLVKLGLVVLMVPAFFVLMLRAMPRGAPLDAVPPHVLPH